jgi:hypothetical protein
VIRAPARPRRASDRADGGVRTVGVAVHSGGQDDIREGRFAFADCSAVLFPFAVTLTYVTKRPRRVLLKGARPTSSPPVRERARHARPRRLEYGGSGEG